MTAEQVAEAAFSDHRFCSDVFIYIARHGLIPSGSRCLLAVSGGLDSMLLLDFFRRFARKKYQAHFVVAHLDHGLREDSAGVSDWLAEICAGLACDFVRQRLDLVSLHRQAEQSSLEAVAREVRYQWLAETARAQGCGLVLTAHTASDQFETLLMRLIRGGISGLAGMPASRPLGSVLLQRPLLGIRRSQIAAYAHHHGLRWQEDLSNQDPAFFRNRVRLQLVPWLQTQNPALEASLAEQAEIWRDEQDWLQVQAEQLFAAEVAQTAAGQVLQTPRLLGLPPALQRRLIRCILTRHLGSWKLYSHRHIEAIRALAAGPGAKHLSLPGDLQVRKAKQQLIFALTRPE